MTSTWYEIDNYYNGGLGSPSFMYRFWGRNFSHLRALQVSPFSKKTPFSSTAAFHLCPQELSIHYVSSVPSAAAAVCVKCYKVAGLL